MAGVLGAAAKAAAGVVGEKVLDSLTSDGNKAENVSTPKIEPTETEVVEPDNETVNTVDFNYNDENENSQYNGTEVENNSNVELSDIELDEIADSISNYDIEQDDNITENNVSDENTNDIEYDISDDELDNIDIDSIDLGDIDNGDIDTHPTVDIGPSNENENAYVKDYNTIEVENIPQYENEQETAKVELPTNGNITENDVMNQTGERPTGEQLQIINEVANKDKDGEIELDERVSPTEITEKLNNLEDNNSDVSTEEVEKEVADDNGDGEIIKDALADYITDDITDDQLDDISNNIADYINNEDEFAKFAEEAEFEEMYEKQKSKADLMFENNIFGDTVFNTKGDLINAIRDTEQYNAGDYDIYIGKDDQGYYYFATPSVKKQRDDDLKYKADHVNASALSTAELKELYNKRTEKERAEKEAAKLKNMDVDKIEYALKTWKVPTPEEWEASYTNGSFGALRSSMAQRQLYIKEYALRNFIANKQLTDDEIKTLRNELRSSGKWNKLKERYPQYLSGKKTGVKNNDYKTRLDLAYRDILEERIKNENAAKQVKTEQQIDNVNKEIEETVFDSPNAIDVNTDEVFVKDDDGNLTELGELDNDLYELTDDELEELEDISQINPDTDKVFGDVYGNTKVLTNPNGWDEYEVDDETFSDEETYLDETKLDNKWTKWNNGTFGRKIQENEWELFGLEKEEYEDSLIEEAKQQADRLGLKEGSYDINVKDSEVVIVPYKKKRLRIPKLPFGNGGRINTKGIEPTDTTNGGNNNSAVGSSFNVDNDSNNFSGSVNVDGRTTTTRDIHNSSVNNTNTDIDVPTDNKTDSISGSVDTVDNKLDSKSSAYKLPSKGTATTKAAREVNNKTDRKFNRQLNSKTDIKSKYRRVGSNSKQLAMSKLHNDVSMMTLIDKIVQKVLKYYHSWTKSGNYWYFNGEKGKIRYSVGGTVEIKLKGETNWASVKTLGKRAGISNKLQELLNEIN